MSISLEGYREKVASAVRHYWTTLGVQAGRPGAGRDTGNRVAVTGGRQMEGFCDLVRWSVARNGMPDASIYVRRNLELPGYFRPTKRWDLVVVHDGHLVAAVEFKSHMGPSFGNNFNNRTEEALGNATDLWTAYREGAFGTERPRPWVGWLMLLESCAKSGNIVNVNSPHFPVFEEFRDTSYRDRYEIMLRKLMMERLYDGAALVLSERNPSNPANFSEPAPDLTTKRFLASLAGHVQSFRASL